jgi:hypothetical protein
MPSPSLLILLPCSPPWLLSLLPARISLWRSKEKLIKPLPPRPSKDGRGRKGRGLGVRRVLQPQLRFPISLQSMQETAPFSRHQDASRFQVVAPNRRLDLLRCLFFFPSFTIYFCFKLYLFSSFLIVLG